MVAVILMVAITVVLATVLYYWALQFMDDKEQPECTLSSYQSDDGDYIIEIGKASREWDAGEAVVVLESRDGKVLEEHELLSLYLRDISFPEVNISFVDKNRDAEVGNGDYFLVKASGNGGPGRENQDFLIIFSSTDDTIGKTSLPARPETKSIEIPALRWNFTTHREEEISLDQNQSASDHTATFINNKFSFFLEFDYTGDDERRLVINLTCGDSLSTVYEEVEQDQDVSRSFDTQLGREWKGQQEYTISVTDNATWELLLEGKSTIEILEEPEETPSFEPAPALLMLGACICGVAGLERGREWKRHL